MNCHRSLRSPLSPSALLLVAAALVGSARAEAPPEATADRAAVVFEVEGQVITQAEFDQEALLHRAEVANEVGSRAADAEGDAVPVARLHAVTRAALVRLAAERALFREHGVPFPADYAALVAACERENQRRAAAVERGGIVFGPKRFSVLAWRDYLHSNARIELQRRLVAAGKLTVSEADVLARFRRLQAAGTIRAEATVDECRAALRASLIEEQYKRLLDDRLHHVRVRDVGLW